MPKILLCILALGCLITYPAYSSTINVPVDQPTIQEGIDAALAGDTVLVSPGTYAGDLNRDLDFGGKTIVVKSEMGPEVTTINPEGTQSEPHRAFRFAGGEDNNAIVEGFNITGGYGPIERDRNIGGGIYCEYSSPTIKNCIFDGNIGDVDGGAISGYGAAPKISSCDFINNNAIHGGTAIFPGTLTEMDFRTVNIS